MNIVVDGRYQIIKRLGKGGFAHTYLAKNLTVPGEPKCVVKQLRPKVEHPRLLQLFKLEAAILARFKHSQIPTQVECFEHQGDFFLVQDFVAGDDLSKEFKIGHQWSEAKVVKFLREMLTVLGYVHEKQVIHGDIKPANIIRRWDNGQLCSIDFGAARDLSAESVEPNTVVGTPGYSAPEQAEGVAVYSSDIYALGMTAIQFLTGQYPLHLPKNEWQEVIWRDLTQISDRLAAILEQMTRVDCVERYECANDVLLDLETFPLDFGDENCCSNPADSRLTSKLMVVTMLLGLGLGSTAAIVNQVESYKTTVEVSLDDDRR
ncbi:serine/threonine-protein kinase [Chamaesiphon minutus]|uniref:non-specific serine/threonine protein kinase n=1 Tax=Chamaesiphon minutus (strain ATCC 27169 / PCC 6605) TaxID=1173020 RepID=K9UAW0_CHAP6|nr:serine/threonine-protein kinase [Chamaesiphon minutus]AFY92247.1 protein kinase family protein [Chamaesiphon minutus PCC 6605]